MNNPITVKIESNIDITDEQKNKLREKLVYAFIEQLRKSGMYKVTEEKDGYAWILRADLILPKKHEAEPVKHGRWLYRIQKDATTVGQHGVTYCSECGYVIFTKADKYCAKCGAKMDLKDNEVI